MDTTYVRLRKSEVLIRMNREIELVVNSYTDPVKSNIKLTEDMQSLIAKNKLSKNDILSAYRTAEILRNLKKEINVAAGRYLSREDASVVIDRFNKKWNKVRVTVGSTSVKLADL